VKPGFLRSWRKVMRRSFIVISYELRVRMELRWELVGPCS
jgi:hypothetical protein